jgi:hypothetical protein
MANGEDGGNGYGRYGGFGRIPSVQTKVEEKNEIKLLLQYFWVSSITIETVQVIFYVAMNTLLKGWDWYAISIGITAGVCAVLYWGMAQRWGVWATVTSDSDFAILWSARAAVLSLFLFVGLTWAVVPTIVKIFEFPEGTTNFFAVIRILFRPFIISLFISVTLSGLFLVLRSWKEMSDSYHSPMEVAKEREMRKTQLALKRAEWEREDTKSPKELPSEHPLVVVSGAPHSREELSTAELRRRSFIDFLEGIQNEMWDTTERSWKKQIMDRSSLPLTKTRGGEIRNWLISQKWAAWSDPANKRGSWRLLYPINQIIEALDSWTGKTFDDAVPQENEEVIES